MITYNGFSLNNGGSTLIPKDEWGPGPRPHTIPDWVKEMPTGTFRFDFCGEYDSGNLESYWKPASAWLYVSGNVFDYVYDRTLAFKPSVPYNTKLIGANLSGIGWIDPLFAGNTGLVSVDNVYAPSITNLAQGFHDCTNLSSFYGEFAPCTRFTQTFLHCTSLTAIPAIDFSNANNLDETFSECTNLQWIRTLKTPNLESCNLTYAHDYNIKKGIEAQYEMWSGQPTIQSHKWCFTECVSDPYYSSLPGDWRNY